MSRVEIPAALPAILGGMRVGVTLAVIGAIVGEWAGGEQGLGVLINIARGSLFDIPLMFATLVTLGLHRGRASTSSWSSSSAAWSATGEPGRPDVPGPLWRRSVPARRPGLVAVALAVLVALLAAACSSGGARARGRDRSTVGDDGRLPPASTGPDASASRPADGNAADRRPGLHPERPVRPVLPRRAGRLLPRRRPRRHAPEQDRPRPHHAPRAGRGRHRLRRRHVGHPGGQPGHPGRLHRDDLRRQFPSVVFAKAVVRDQRPRPTSRARGSASPARTARRGSCSRRCSSRPA